MAYPLTSISIVVVLALSSIALAQRPAPAVELAKLEDFVGNWHGSGTSSSSLTGENKWEARATYKWCLDKQWLQEDYVLRETPLTKGGEPSESTRRGYYGWDSNKRQYVALFVEDGNIRLHKFGVQHRGWIAYSFPAWGPPGYWDSGDPNTVFVQMFQTEDAIVTRETVLGSTGNATDLDERKMVRVVKGKEMDVTQDGALGTGVSEPLQQLTRAVGSYDVSREAYLKPGEQPKNMKTIDEFGFISGGHVLHGRSRLVADNRPGRHWRDWFLAFDSERQCLVVASLDSMGLRVADGWFDGDKLVYAESNAIAGSVGAHRTVVSFDTDGHFLHEATQSMVLQLPPFESCRADYIRR